MKHIYLLYILILGLTTLGHFTYAQGNEPKTSNQSLSNTFEPEDIKEPVREKTNFYYLNQSMLWNNNAIQTPQNAEAWLNYYKAERYSNYTPANKNISVLKQTKLDKIVSEMESNVPQTFEFYFAKYLNGNYNIDLSENLLKAYELQPNNVEIYDDLIAYYEIIDKDAKKKEFALKLYQSNTIPQYVYDYNYNLLLGLEKNAILITNGYDDTYPIWILQSVQGIRKDVHVLNLDILQNSTYRDKILKNLNLKSDVTSSYKHYKSEFIYSLGHQNPDKNIYLGLTVNPEILKKLKTNLFLTGLAFKFSNYPFDNLNELEQYWNKKIDKNKMHLDEYKVKSAAYHPKTLSSNYLILLAVLEKYYYQKGEFKKADKMYDEAFQHAELIGKENILIQRRARSVPMH